MWREKDDNKKESRKWETESSALPTKQENRQLREKERKKRERREQQSAMAALNYCAGAGFIRIPSPRCSLSGGIKEEDTQSGFSLRPYRRCTQRTALTAAKRDSGGGGRWEGWWGWGEVKRWTKVGWEGGKTWGEGKGRGCTCREKWMEIEKKDCLMYHFNLLWLIC